MRGAVGIRSRKTYFMWRGEGRTIMNDLISRQAVIDAIENTDWYHQNKNKDMVHGANSSEHQAWYKAEDVYKALKNVPSAQPEQKKGKWIEDRLISTGGGTYGVRRCSECEAYYQDVGYGWNYCPNCGARMEVEG